MVVHVDVGLGSRGLVNGKPFFVGFLFRLSLSLSLYISLSISRYMYMYYQK